MFSIQIDSIQQDQLTGKGLLNWFKRSEVDMDTSLVIIGKQFIGKCIGYRIHKKIAMTTRGCELVFPNLLSDVMVAFLELPGILSASATNVKAKTSENPKDCGDLVFIEVSVSKQN